MYGHIWFSGGGISQWFGLRFIRSAEGKEIYASLRVSALRDQRGEKCGPVGDWLIEWLICDWFVIDWFLESWIIDLWLVDWLNGWFVIGWLIDWIVDLSLKDSCVVDWLLVSDWVVDLSLIPWVVIDWLIGWFTLRSIQIQSSWTGPWRFGRTCRGPRDDRSGTHHEADLRGCSRINNTKYIFFFFYCNITLYNFFRTLDSKITSHKFCQVLESNGSSSMASVCAASLALLDAGLKIETPVG